MTADVSIPDYDDLDAVARARWDEQIARHGRVTHMKRTLLHAVPAFDALMTWYPLFDAVKAVVGERAALFFAHAISAANHCLICDTFFVKILRDRGLDPANLVYDATEDLLVRFGRALVADGGRVPDALLGEVKASFGEADLVLLTGFASLMIATNLINTALRVPLDEYLYAYTAVRSE
ncbi:hypothetical protein EYW49_07535 [Siculibacillus lacustris]|uniref:Uncharacterized protein n=1 Tax=Siculibacillus lacustris TaxID=1549641 RepID=A0A4Q9VUX7_9HYPH|nr:hypothetical protein [Siculibacillus lacustris]TBW38973.1 hypothetical protein EYW49_07535 [Siculibacillus lacustris]